MVRQSTYPLGNFISIWKCKSLFSASLGVVVAVGVRAMVMVMVMVRVRVKVKV